VESVHGARQAGTGGPGAQAGREQHRVVPLAAARGCECAAPVRRDVGPQWAELDEWLGPYPHQSKLDFRDPRDSNPRQPPDRGAAPRVSNRGFHSLGPDRGFALVILTTLTTTSPPSPLCSWPVRPSRPQSTFSSRVRISGPTLGANGLVLTLLSLRARASSSPSPRGQPRCK
jgi:hypothetical protein